MFKRLDISKWLGALFAPIEKNSAFLVFMFVLGYLCTQLEIMPYYLRNRGAEPYDLSVPELFLDIYIVCALLALIPRKVRVCVRALLYVLFYGVAIVDMYCYERFESTLTPTMLMLVGETTPQEAGEFLEGYLSWDILGSMVGWVLLLILVHILWTFVRSALCRRFLQMMALPQVNPVVVTSLKTLLSLVVAGLLVVCVSETWDNKVAMHRISVPLPTIWHPISWYS